jgi:CheY-like chemotaxis protein
VSAGGADPKKRVLVIDDNPVNLRISAALIRKAGFVADTAETAEAGLDRLAGTLPDLIVTDLQLPGMDGLELTRTVKKDPAWKHIPVILLTAAHSREEDAIAREAGCECSIGKPVDAELFPGIIRAFLGASVPTEETSSLEGLPIEELAHEFLAKGAVECHELVNRLTATKRMLVPELDFVGIRNSLHRWAGVGGTIGLPEITRQSRELEALLAAYQPGERVTLHKKLIRLLDLFQNAVPAPVAVPVARSAPAPLPALVPAPPKEGIKDVGGVATGKPVILVGDDNPTIRAVVKQALERAGFQCLVAADGVRALTMALSHPPDVIILDLNMPGMTGFEVLYWLRDQWSTCKVPTIVLTASHEESDIRRGVELGVAGYLIKPVDINDLVARVEQLIGRKQ